MILIIILYSELLDGGIRGLQFLLDLRNSNPQLLILLQLTISLLLLFLYVGSLLLMNPTTLLQFLLHLLSILYQVLVLQLQLHSFSSLYLQLLIVLQDLTHSGFKVFDCILSITQANLYHRHLFTPPLCLYVLLLPYLNIIERHSILRLSRHIQELLVGPIVGELLLSRQTSAV